MYHDSKTIFNVGQPVTYCENDREHSGRIAGLSTCRCELTGYVDSDWEGGTWSDHGLPHAAGQHAGMILNDEFCRVSGEEAQTKAVSMVGMCASFQLLARGVIR